MRSTAAVLCFWFCYHLVLCGEIPDVTTIYEVGYGKASVVENQKNELSFETTTEAESGSDEDLPLLPPRMIPTTYQPPCKDVKGHVHARTNALGLGIVNEKNKYFDYKSSEIPNVICDPNYPTNDSCAQWDLTNSNNIDYTSNTRGRTFTKGVAYKVFKEVTLNLKNINSKRHYLIFTQGPGTLNIETTYVIIDFNRNGHGHASVFYNCNKNSHQYSFSLFDSKGLPTVIRCNSHYDNFYLSYDDDYLTFDFGIGNSRGFRLYKDKSKSATVDFQSQDFDINYMSLHSDTPDSFSIITRGIEVTAKDIVSPIFTPQSSNLFLAIHLYASEISSKPQLNTYVLGLLPNDRQLKDTYIIQSGWNTRRVNVSLANLEPKKLSFSVSAPSKVGITRIAACNPDGEEVIELPSSISVCPYDQRIHLWGSTKSSLQLHTTTTFSFDPVKPVTDTTNNCWNGGVLTEAGCACAPGFSGSTCEIGCGRNRYGQDCEGLCSLYSEECRGLLLCTQFTGCRCAPGYHGEDCTQACSTGWYGNDCAERCGHCADSSNCDIYTGECEACEEGYLAPHCKLASVYYGSKPELTATSYGTIIVLFDPSNYVTHGEPPQIYQIQIREKEGQWRIHTSKSLQKSSDEAEKERRVSEKIEGLKPGVLYEVKVLLIDADFFKYDGKLVEVAEILTKCDIPSYYDYKLTAVTNETAITFSWRYVIEDQHWCPLETFEVTWQEGWKHKSVLGQENSFTLSGLAPGSAVRFKVRAKTSAGFAPYSKTITTSIQWSVLPPVQNLRVESRQSTSVELSWEQPRGSGDSQLRYTISYKCLDRPACSSGCQNVSEGQLTQAGTSITLSPLLPFTMYLVTVRAEGGTKSSVFVGTTKVVPTEVPVLSAQRPVRTNTSLTVFWEQGSVCTGFQLGYNYQLTKASEDLKILESGFTKETSVSFHNLTASTEYVVRVFVTTVAGWNPLRYLAININTSATVPEAVRNLTVYKRGRGMLGLRWAEPRATYGLLKSFTVSHSLGQSSVSHTVEPTHCVAWPHLYCLTIDGLRSSRLYNLSVSARNSEVAEDGELSFVSAVTKESPSSAPVNLRVTNSSSTSLELEWDHPDMANGVLRSFLISVEETEKYDQETCCQVYPFIEISVTEELQKYKAEVSGLHPASTYFVSVSGKTVGLGPSQTLTASTRPPHAPFTTLPTVLPSVPDVSWLPQNKLPEVNNSDIYTALIRAHLLLAVPNDTQAVLLASESGITDPKLDSLLKMEIGKPFYFMTEYTQDDDVEVAGPLEDSDSTWGRPPVPALIPGSYLLVAAQVLEYSGTYNADLRYSQPFSLT